MKIFFLYFAAIFCIEHGFDIVDESIIWSAEYKSNYTINDLHIAAASSGALSNVQLIETTVIADFNSIGKVYKGLKYPIFTQSILSGKIIFNMTPDGYNVTAKNMTYSIKELNIFNEKLEAVAIKKGNYRKKFFKYIDGYDSTLEGIADL